MWLAPTAGSRLEMYSRKDDGSRVRSTRQMTDGEEVERIETPSLNDHTNIRRVA